MAMVRTLVRGVPGAVSFRAATESYVGTPQRIALAPHLLLDFVDVIGVISEGGVNVRESHGRNLGDDLVGSYALVLMPHDNIEHTDAVASDTGLAAAKAGRPANSVHHVN